MNHDDAEEYTQALGQVVAGSWRQVALGRRLGVPKALGLTTAQWVEERLGGYVRLSLPERREAVAELTAPQENGGMGLSQREAGEVLGVSPMTVNRDLRNDETKVTDDEPEALPSVSEVTDDRVERQAERRLEVWVDRIKVGLRTLARMADYPVPPAISERLDEHEAQALITVLDAMKGGDYARFLG